MKNDLTKFLRVSGFSLNAAHPHPVEWWDRQGEGFMVRVEVGSDAVSVYRFAGEILQWQIKSLDLDAIPMPIIKSIIRKAMMF